jgi:hypothetical protein
MSEGVKLQASKLKLLLHHSQRSRAILEVSKARGPESPGPSVFEMDEAARSGVVKALGNAILSVAKGVLSLCFVFVQSTLGPQQTQ